MKNFVNLLLLFDAWFFFDAYLCVFHPLSQCWEPKFEAPHARAGFESMEPKNVRMLH